MTDNKIYLNVPYAQKDAAKALGARWDPAMKKWYLPAGKDIAPLAQWLAEAENQPRQRMSGSSIETSGGVFTHPSSKDFAPYNGLEPPWD